MSKKTQKKSKAPAVVTKSKTAKKPGGGDSELPSKIFAQASPTSLGGVSMFDAGNQIQADTVANFFSDQDATGEAVARLQEAGFEVLQVSALTINFSGSPSTFKRAFNTEIVVEDRPVFKMDGKDVGQFLETPETGTPGLIDTSATKFENSIEGIALEEPRYYMAASMYAPLKSYWHLRVPGDVSLACNADKAHRTGITGKGVKVAMVDSGQFKHPFFAGRGYNVSPTVLGPGASFPLKDEVGHGTGESANIFAVAPDVTLLPVKANLTNALGAFNAAVGLNPNIITCSWGSNKPTTLSAADMALATAIALAVASGITVIFSAGNGSFGFPGQHPDVISAGGCFMKPDESLNATNYASGFISTIYPGRRSPDLCGLVGTLPKAIYIMLPLEPGDQIDVGNAGLTHPNGDETTNSDGWAAFSGTSAAAPQLAGAAALIKQACPALKPAAIKDILRKTARDITLGNCAASTGGFAATVGPDTATGDGLVDAHKAVMLAKVKCLGPIVLPGPGPIISPGPSPGPIPVISPGPKTGPIPVIAPGPTTGPIPVVGPKPTPGPIPVVGPKPTPGPLPVLAPKPPLPPQPIGFSESAEPPATEPQQQGERLSESDIQSLEQMIIDSDFEID